MWVEECSYKEVLMMMMHVELFCRFGLFLLAFSFEKNGRLVILS